MKALGATFAVGVLLLVESFASSVSEEIANMADEEAVSFLAGEIWRGSLSASNAARGEEAATLITEIEGHAEILAKRFENKRSSQDYQNSRIKFFKILSTIDSGESVAVLSSYLADEADTLNEEQIIQSSRRNSDTSPIVSNALLAAEALDAMELPDAPLNKLPGSYVSGDVEVWRNWWRTRDSTELAVILDSPDDIGSTSDAPTPVDSTLRDIGQSEGPKVGDSGSWKIFLGALVVLALVLAIFAGRNRINKR